MRMDFNVPNIRYIFYRCHVFIKRKTVFFIVIHAALLAVQYDIETYRILVPTAHRRQKYTENEFVLTKK